MSKRTKVFVAAYMAVTLMVWVLYNMQDIPIVFMDTRGKVCGDCEEKVVGFVLQSVSKNWFIISGCECGPNDRESGYYSTREEAVCALREGTYSI